MNEGTPASRQREIPEKMDRLSARTENLLKVVSELESRLEPFMTSRPPNPVASAPTLSASTALGKQLTENIERVSSAKETVESILSRLEI